ncbi:MULTISPECIES: hypothetical protein [Mycobacterium]|nr:MULTISPECIES: hypothetical protein [Mycobacterium]ELR85526.1 hypothetical protein W7U_09865 [Mycobacterium sp. H4Y]MCF1814977.1 hypothetical protein [Mycobacterium intracellulare subsp. intracellulare]MDM3897871.1 hypothetical protein [Mycobacterium intracellulare]MDM3909293.1 hypothetical protein [Mycobacterium intracellulare subsp. chimaera]MDM3929744.1 hypothetical protein [Mycobacterium intracellulare subsp. chimaera]
MPGSELGEVVERIWDQLPGPRVRIDITDKESIDSALDRAGAELLDSGRQRDDARDRAQSPGPDHRGHHGGTAHGGTDHGGTDRGAMDHSGHHGMDHGAIEHGDMDHHNMDHDAMEHGAMEHGDMDHSAMDHSGHHGMDHGGMEMAPAGIALAEGGEDRDGLEMDVLHLRLGPVLPHWPAGLVLRCSLQGDVLAEAEAWIVDNDHESGYKAPPEHTELVAAARQCDHVVDLLELSGWWRASVIARRARDLLLGDSDVDRARELLDGLHKMLGKSRLLRWSLRDLAPLTAESLDRHELPAALAGDTYDRLLTRVGQARTLLREPLSSSLFELDSTKISDALPAVVRGLDVATARLVVASLGIDTARANESIPHG